MTSIARQDLSWVGLDVHKISISAAVLVDTGVALHLLASLMAEARARLPRAVADARDQDCSWGQVAELLGVTRASAWQRYAGRTARASTPLEAG
jgi:hypothetical protein